MESVIFLLHTDYDMEACIHSYIFDEIVQWLLKPLSHAYKSIDFLTDVVNKKAFCQNM